MSRKWAGSTRRAELPQDWDQIVKRITARDGGRCRQIDPETQRRCTRIGKEVDHVNDKLDHRDSNLQLLCKGHHREKTLRERSKPKAVRKPEPHPGWIKREGQHGPR